MADCGATESTLVGVAPESVMHKTGSGIRQISSRSGHSMKPHKTQFTSTPRSFNGRNNRAEGTAIAAYAVRHCATASVTESASPSPCPTARAYQPVTVSASRLGYILRTSSHSTCFTLSSICARSLPAFRPQTPPFRSPALCFDSFTL